MSTKVALDDIPIEAEPDVVLSPDAKRFVDAALAVNKIAHDLVPGIRHDFGFEVMNAIHDDPALAGLIVAALAPTRWDSE